VGEIQTVESFTEFVREVEPRLKRALVAAFGVERGLEAVSEALAYGWEHWDQVKKRPNPAGYLFGVGRNKARRGIRRRLVFPETPIDHDLWVEPGLPAGLQRLSERQRVTVMLIHGDEWTLREVADLLGVSVPTVQQHADRGMAKLRAAMGVTK
jgi:DNA-directed RNA polymerase specialized sigma24 family protein